MGRPDATQLYIIALRVATELGDHKLAVELYEKAIEIEIPIAGGHPTAMINAAYHYENGLGVKQDYQRAFQLYQRVVEHPHAGEENMAPAFQGLSRFYKHGLGGVVQKNRELEIKYHSFSMSNAEKKEDILALEMWWKENSSKVKTKQPDNLNKN